MCERSAGQIAGFFPAHESGVTAAALQDATTKASGGASLLDIRIWLAPPQSPASREVASGPRKKLKS